MPTPPGYHARIRKLTGLDALNNSKPWKVSYMVDTRHPGVTTVVGTTYHETHTEALHNATDWTDKHAKNTRPTP